MKNSFLNYYQQILDKVSFDLDLLTKEYKKALQQLDEEEVDELQRWLNKTGLATLMIRADTNLDK